MNSWQALFAVLVLLAGCGTVGEEDAPLGQAIAALSGPAEFEPRFIALLKAEAPALQVGFIEKETNGTMLLERRKGAFEFWLSSDGGQLILQGGILHGTRGFGEGLLASELSEPLAHVRGLRAGYSDRFHTYLDGNDRALTRTYRCVIELAGPRDLPFTTGNVATQLVREDCQSLTQSFRNLYWVVPGTGRIVQSRQWAGPFLGDISTRILQ